MGSLSERLCTVLATCIQGIQDQTEAVIDRLTGGVESLSYHIWIEEFVLFAQT